MFIIKILEGLTQNISAGHSGGDRISDSDSEDAGSIPAGATSPAEA